MATTLSLLQTERGIKLIKDTFEHKLADALDLHRVSAPRFLEAGDGLQDDLAGTQEPVSFRVPHADHPVEMVHSLAKWKRSALARYAIKAGEGIYTDMDAVRKDEIVDDIHSTYVDQWDWERVITAEQRTMVYLQETVRTIYRVMRDTQTAVHHEFDALEPRLPEDIAFVHAQELEDRWPELSPPEREGKAAEEHGALFLVGIGAPLASGAPHDARAADYDDWITETSPGHRGLNGDIIVYDHTRGSSLELSSMGIRVDSTSLVEQLRLMDQEDRVELEFHRGILENTLPLSIGGGIGESRLCMLLLHKPHIAEVQVSVWPQTMRQDYATRGVHFL